jgi:hypothetical protein
MVPGKDEKINDRAREHRWKEFLKARRKYFG